MPWRRDRKSLYVAVPGLIQALNPGQGYPISEVHPVPLADHRRQRSQDILRIGELSTSAWHSGIMIAEVLVVQYQFYKLDSDPTIPGSRYVCIMVQYGTSPQPRTRSFM